jgi:hypothetical protein
MNDSTSVAGLISALTFTDDSGVTRVEFGTDPAAVNVLGAAMAEAARALNPTVVLSWAGEGDSVLAHVVAAELGVTRAVIELDLGLLTISPPLADASRALLVGGQLTADRQIEPIATMLDSRGHTLVLAAALTGPAVAGGAPVIVLS